MPNLRDIKRRIGSVQSTKQITRTMEMVATAKIRHATERIAAAQPYAEAMRKTLSGVAAHAGNVDHPLLQEHETKKKALAVVVVSDRGLAGGFNSNILRMADRYIAEGAEKGVETKVIVCGKKGTGYFRYRHVEPVLSFADLSADPTIAEAREIASYVRSAYADGLADEVRVFYNHARNAADQDICDEVVLPIKADGFAAKPEADEEGAPSASTDFEPSAADVLDRLLPAYVETMVYHALIDSAAAEQGARRKAMKSATDNANEMESTLNRLFNRVRQGAITTEITEIVGGAAALEDE